MQLWPLPFLHSLPTWNGLKMGARDLRTVMPVFVVVEICQVFPTFPLIYCSRQHGWQEEHLSSQACVAEVRLDSFSSSPPAYPSVPPG